jgi:hypothetical protein
MHSKIAGVFDLQALVQQHIDVAREKVAQAGGARAVPAAPGPKKEKTASAARPAPVVQDDVPEILDEAEVEKLASALDVLGEKVASDSTFIGGESKQGGETLPTQNVTSGTQPAKKDKSRSHNIPTSTGMQKGDDNGASTQVPNDHNRAPGGGAKYPKEGVLRKTAGESPIMSRILGKQGTPPTSEKKDPKKDKEETGSEKDKETEKKASAAVDFILAKVAEAKGGGQVLTDDQSGNNPKPSMTGPRSLIASNAAATNAKRVQAKAGPKKDLTQVLTEPAQSAAHDSTVQQNLTHAREGGVKIASQAKRVLLEKIASGGCTCGGEGGCQYCKLKAAIEKKKAS